MSNLPMIQPQSMAEALKFSEIIASSSFVPQAYRGKPHDILIAMQMGSELGLRPMQALQNIAVINGRPSVWGDAMLAIVQGHSDFEDIQETVDDHGATCTVKRKGRSPTVRAFTIENAKKAGLWGRKGPWSDYPSRMLQMRARSFALRDSFADALRGVITGEEASDIPTQDNRQEITAQATNVDNGDSLNLSGVLEAIEKCRTIDDLKSIVEIASKLPEDEKNIAREAFHKRQESLRGTLESRLRGAVSNNDEYEVEYVSE